ncbi:MAG: hypothetical protein IJZ79_02120 [Bacilli bacterium]|nr:hypothetical protein [Bacilli bacterium]
MITLKGSRFIVERDENSKTDIDFKVFISQNKEYKDITHSMTDEDKNELISDLIYAVDDLLKKTN